MGYKAVKLSEQTAIYLNRVKSIILKYTTKNKVTDDDGIKQALLLFMDYSEYHIKKGDIDVNKYRNRRKANKTKAKSAHDAKKDSGRRSL